MKEENCDGTAEMSYCETSVEMLEASQKEKEGETREPSACEPSEICFKDWIVRVNSHTIESKLSNGNRPLWRSVRPII